MHSPVFAQPVQPMLTEMKLVGRAMPAVMSDIHRPQKHPFGLLTEALDQLQLGEIYVVGGGETRCAYWGKSSPPPRKSGELAARS